MPKETKTKSKSKHSKTKPPNLSDITGLYISPHKIKRRIKNYYKSFGEESLRFANGPSTYVFMTSIIEQLMEDVFKLVVDIYSKDDATVVINRKCIKKILEKEEHYKRLFHIAIMDHKTESDVPDYSFMTDAKFDEWMNAKYDKPFEITPPAIIFLRYLVNYSVDQIIYNLVQIHNSSSTKSITLEQCKSSSRIYLKEHLYKKFEKKAEKVVKLAMNDNEKKKKSSSGKKKNKKKKSSSSSSDDDSGTESDSDKKTNSKKKKDSSSDDESDDDEDDDEDSSKKVNKKKSSKKSDDEESDND